MTTRRKKKSQDGFLKKVSSLFNLDTVSHSIESNFRASSSTIPVPRLSSGNAGGAWPRVRPRCGGSRPSVDAVIDNEVANRVPEARG